VKASINTLSLWTNVDRRTIGRRLESLAFETGPKRAHLYETSTALRLILCPGMGGDGGQLDPAQQRARLDAARASEVEDRTRLRRGELLLATDYERELASAIKVTASTLESLPDRAERDAGASPEVVELLQAVIDKLREELYRRLAGRG